MSQKCPLCQKEIVFGMDPFLALFQQTTMCWGCRKRVCHDCYHKAAELCIRCAPLPPVLCVSCSTLCTPSTPICSSCLRPTCAACVQSISEKGARCVMCPVDIKEPPQRRQSPASTHNAVTNVQGTAVATPSSGFAIRKLEDGGQVLMCVENTDVLQNREGLRIGDEVMFSENGMLLSGRIEGFTSHYLIVRLLPEYGERHNSLVQLDRMYLAGGEERPRWRFCSKVPMNFGGQGKIYKCTIVGTDEVFAAKEMKFDLPTEQQEFDRNLAQAKLFCDLKGPYLIEYRDVYAHITDNGEATIITIMPYYSEGNLKALIQSCTQPIEEQKICNLAHQIAQALSYLHTQEPPLVHRDVKPENILLCNDTAVLIDFETSRAIVGRGMTVGRGTMDYMAPECISGVGIGMKCDIWSLGVVMFVLAASVEFPMLRLGSDTVLLNCSLWTEAALRSAIIGAIAASSRSYSRQLVELIVKMLNIDQCLRPTAAEVIKKLKEISRECNYVLM